MKPKNIFYAQSGGPTAVINATAATLIQTATSSPVLGKVYAGKNGIVGALREELIDTSLESTSSIEQLKHTPGSAFGSCRYKLTDPNQDDTQYRRLLEVFKAHQIGYFFYNGGGDSQDTAHKISQFFAHQNYPLTVIGLPKTIDNDLPHTDCCPGFGSVAKYLASSIQGTALDLKSMAETSTKVFILEVMGRHTGWIAASSALSQRGATHAPHMILLPEVAFNSSHFLNKLQRTVEQEGHCVIVTSEGLRDEQGQFLTQSLERDVFGHTQLGGIAPHLSRMITQELGIKNQWAVAGYLQRSARYIASETDLDHACAIGKAAIELALSGINNVMLTIQRLSTTPYQWNIGSVPLSSVANIEKMLPPHFIHEDGFGVTQACLDYLQPLIEGQAPQPFEHGIPQYTPLKNHLLDKKPLPIFEMD
ncbi:MAG: 6-phosphofructokinase [Coxiellaceae bacterium]|nr:6-phosphofructokinase [Coxiellaceae bacterium]